MRIIAHTTFARGMRISIGHNIQLGKYCNIAFDVVFKNNILVAERVRFVGRNDHQFGTVGELTWNSSRGYNGITIVEDDVWTGYSATIVGGITTGKGVVIAAGAVVTQDIPDCEIWGDVPTKKIKDRFSTISEKEHHLRYIKRI